ELLIFDQFEEILTLDPTDRQEKEQFFTVLGEALVNRQRWALFVMREEFIASLEPYRHLVPTGVSTTFRLDLLDTEAAVASIRGPALKLGVQFDLDAAEQLVNDLSRMRVQTIDGQTVEKIGPYVEPVQLQVVCD